MEARPATQPATAWVLLFFLKRLGWEQRRCVETFARSEREVADDSKKKKKKKSVQMFSLECALILFALRDDAMTRPLLLHCSFPSK